MSRVIALDPAKTAPLEPSEGDGCVGSWISPFDIPRSVELVGPSPDEILAIGFRYDGGEEGDVRDDFADRESPTIQARVGRLSGKILELDFGRPVSRADLPAIARRVSRRADDRPALSARFNHLMIANIFRDWASVAEGLG